MDPWGVLQRFVSDFYSTPHLAVRYPWPTPNGSSPEVLAVKKWCSDCRSVLDVGCGTGRLTLALAREGFETIGLDLSPGAVKVANELARKDSLRCRCYVCNLLDWDALGKTLPQKEFDAVYLTNNILQNIPTRQLRETALRNAARLVRPGGVLLITVQPILGVYPRFIAWECFKYAAGAWVKRDNRPFFEFGDILLSNNQEFVHFFFLPALIDLLEGMGHQMLQCSPSRHLVGESGVKWLAQFIQDTWFLVVQTPLIQAHRE